jgi:hypothetical protein
MRFTHDASKCIVWPLFLNDLSDPENIKGFENILEEQFETIDTGDVMQVILTSYFYNIMQQLDQFPEIK